MYIKIKAKPGAKEEKVVKRSDDHYEISVREKAKNNQANRRILEIVSDIFQTKKVRIISGHQTTGKIISVDI